MKIGKFQISKFKEPEQIIQVETFPRNMGTEVSSADSSYYDGYSYKPNNPDALWQKTGSYSVFDDMRQDDQINSILSLKKLIVLNAPFEIECEDEIVKDFLEDCLMKYTDDIFVKYLYQILTAFDYGFSVTEKLFSLMDIEGKTRVILKALKTRAPHTFELPTDEKGNLESIIQHTSGADKELDKAKFIVYSHNKEFDNFHGKSELNRGVYRAYWSKNTIIKFWNIYLERFGMPTVVGKIPRGAGTGDSEAFKSVLNDIQAKTSMTIPIDFMVELLQVAKGAGEYEAAIDKYNTMMARSMLVPDLLGYSGGETGGGSYSLGQEQFNIFYSAIEYIRNDIVRIVNKEIINPLVLWNFGNKIKAKFKFKKVDEERRQADLQTWLGAVNTGKIPVTDAHVNWFLNSVNAPEISEEELAEIQKEKDEMREQITNGGNNKSGLDESEEDTKKDKKENPLDEKKDKEIEKADDKKKFAEDERWRPLNVYEKKVDFKQVENDFNTLEDKYMIELESVFRLIGNALINDIRERKIVEKKRLDLVNKIALKHTAKLKKTLIMMLKESYARGDSSVRKFGLFEDLPSLNPDEVEIWIKEYADFLGLTEEDYILKETRAILIEGIRNGDSIKAIVNQLSVALNGYSLSDNANRLDLIVRTSVSKAYNEARFQDYAQREEYIVGWFYSAILDGRTSPLCKRLDSDSAGIYKPEQIASIKPPNHFRCRSMMLPVYEDEPIPEKWATMPDLEDQGAGFVKLKTQPKEARTEE